MLSSTLKKLAKAKALVARLEAEVDSKKIEQLAGLPARYGFEDAGTFVAAVMEASGGRPGHKALKPATGKAPRSRRRATITDETRTEVKKLAQAGETGAAIAGKLGISLPSVQNIKKALGLVKARGKTAKSGQKPAKKKRAKAKASPSAKGEGAGAAKAE